MTQSDSGFITKEIVGTTLVLRFNRPEKHNALTLSMYSELTDAITSAQMNDSIRVVLITGGDRCFTAGNDLHDFLVSPPQDHQAPVFRFMAAVIALDKPLIAAVCGIAIGIGTTLLAHCDLVYVTHVSSFSMPFAKLGVCQEFGASVTMPHILGPRRASQLLMCGDTFTGQEAVAWGLANAGFATSAACHDAALRQAAYLGSLPQRALRDSKVLLRSGIPNLESTLARESELLIAHLAREDAQSAIRHVLR